MDESNKKPKHTPGPWQCTKYPKVFSINSVSGRQIAIMTEHYGDCPMVPMSQFERSEQDKADAALIAAAPDCLAALENCAEQLRQAWACIEHIKDHAPVDECKDAIATMKDIHALEAVAEKTIAKARGKS